MEQQVNVFFDESGKDKSKLSLLGALLVPENYYVTSEIQSLNNRLKALDFKLHFTALTRDTEPDHYATIKAFLKYPDFLKCNIVGFKRSKHMAGHEHLNSSTSINTMIYSKIPERVLYGVLRDFGNFAPVQANIYIEDSTEYTNLQLNKNVKSQLNVHSLYRHENFWVDKCGLYPKNKEIGIEFIDTILGMLRIIIENEDVLFLNGEAQNKFKTLWRKKHFIGRNIKLLDNFLCNINYFELNGHSRLEKIDVRIYLNLFLAKYYLELTYREQSKELKGGIATVSSDSDIPC